MRIGFLALSGIRACDPELVALGLTLPGVWNQLAREGRLLDDRAYERCTLFDVNFAPQGMSVEALRAAMRRLVVELYSDSATTARRDQFHETWLREQARRLTRRRLVHAG